MFLDIGGRFYEAMKNSNKSYIDKDQFEKIITEWFEEHGKPLSDKDKKEGLEEIWKEINTEDPENGQLTKGEILNYLFKKMDVN